MSSWSYVVGVARPAYECVQGEGGLLHLGACCVVVWQASLSLASHFWALFGLLVRGVENAVPSREGMEVVGSLATWDLVRHPAHSWASPQASDSIRVSSSACCLLLLLPLIHFIFFPFYMSPCARVHLFADMVNIQNGTAEVQFLGQEKAGHH